MLRTGTHGQSFQRRSHKWIPVDEGKCVTVNVKGSSAHRAAASLSLLATARARPREVIWWSMVRPLHGYCVRDMPAEDCL